MSEACVMATDELACHAEMISLPPSHIIWEILKLPAVSDRLQAHDVCKGPIIESARLAGVLVPQFIPI
jgi:hypothetical protein